MNRGTISGIPLAPYPLTNHTITAIDEDTNQTVSVNISVRILKDTDGDGKPDVGTSNWVEDLDDDDDGYLDSKEDECETDPQDPTKFPELDDEGNCVQEGVTTDDPITPDRTTNVYYWCILPLAIILVVLFFTLMAREREKSLKKDEEKALDEAD